MYIFGILILAGVGMLYIILALAIIGHINTNTKDK